MTTIYITLIIFVLINIPNAAGVTVPLLALYSENYKNNSNKLAMVRNYKIQFYVTVMVGKPPQKQYVLVDTGSDITWLQGSTCQPCFAQTSDKFTREMSKTLETVSWKDDICDGEDFIRRRSKGMGRCDYTVNYDDHCYSSGYVVRDYFRLLGSRSAITKKLYFGIATEAEPNGAFINGMIGGILGMGNTVHSLIGQISKESRRFSVCLDSRRGSLSLGKDVPTIDGTFTNVDFIEQKYREYAWHYELVFSGVRVNNQIVDLSTVRNMQRIIIDTGSTNTYIGGQLYDLMTAALKEYFFQQHYLTISNGHNGYNLCYLYSGNIFPAPDVILPEVRFYFPGGEQVFMSFQGGQIFKEYRINRSPLICFKLIRQEGDSSLLGGEQLYGLLLVFDFKSQKLFYRSQDCRM
ncbi:Eukaryotic aspartyl protease family protein [Rhynchospora pubera]|uniref:Eukaryotic aspartyl protease family protein n=1 Tax=Rhynchospora pubera TaxID=906938 RepID=A0AAV8GSZ1_9POAL|nr:Eukaryotic aspartyl protease family protein [Rhynchospora pubera]